MHECVQYGTVRWGRGGGGWVEMVKHFGFDVRGVNSCPMLSPTPLCKDGKEPTKCVFLGRRVLVCGVN